jgi:carbon-monoxide dehydrogenase medium subunit
MAELKEKARPLAGGTDLLVNMKKDVVSPENVVSLDRIDALKEKNLANGQMRLGACLKAADIGNSEEINALLSAVGISGSSLGSPLIRNLATIGGNIVTARPAADFPPSLLVYDAQVVLKKADGERRVPLNEFFVGPGETIMTPDEILTEVVMDRPPDFSGSGYIKLGLRKALEISIVNVASFIALDGKDGSITSARVALGAVAPVPMRAVSAEKVLVGEKPGETLFEKAGEAAADDSKPIDDFRGSAEYRRAMVGVLTKRTLNLALEKARG